MSDLEDLVREELRARVALARRAARPSKRRRPPGHGPANRYRGDAAWLGHRCLWRRTDLGARGLALVKATRSAAFHCVPPPDIAGSMRPSHGVVVGAGRYVSAYGPHQACRSLHRLRACFGTPTPGRPLEIVVFVPGRPKPTVIDIGLKGNGAEPRTIFESIGPR